jgi:hypothetical protein
VAPEALSKPREEKSKFQGSKIKARGRKIKARGSEIQIICFRKSRLFSALNLESKKAGIVWLGSPIKQGVEAKPATAPSSLAHSPWI